MIRIFNKWFGFSLELSKYYFDLKIGLWFLFYLNIDWSEPYSMIKFAIRKNKRTWFILWKHFEIGVVAL